MYDDNTGSPTETMASAETSAGTVVTPKKRCGFAAMDRRKVSEIASKGGKAAHAAGTAHQFTSEEARDAGRKGGSSPRRRSIRTPAGG